MRKQRKLGPFFRTSIIPLSNLHQACFSIMVNEWVSRNIPVHMDESSYFDTSMYRSHLFCLDWDNRIASDKNIVSDDKIAFSMTIIVRKTGTTSKIHPLARNHMSNACTIVFCFVSLIKVRFFDFTANHWSLTKSRVSNNRSPEYFDIFFSDTFLYTSITFYDCSFTNDRISYQAKRPNSDAMTYLAIGDDGSRVYNWRHE